MQRFQNTISLVNQHMKCWTRNVSITNILRAEHKVSNFEKKILVWSGKYKSTSKVPNLVKSEELDRAKSKARIRVANIMIVFTLIGCLFVSIYGRRARDAGDSVHKRNIEFHEQYEKKK